jgi:hypothetical protein
MAAVQWLTGLSLFTAANLINALLFALLSVSFVSIVAAMTPSRRTIWLAFICVLLYPHLNEFRAYLIRDIGYLAYCLHRVIATALWPVFFAELSGCRHVPP